MNDYTTLSKQSFDEAFSVTMTSEKAAEWLLTAKDFRTLPEKLLKFYSGGADSMKELIRTGLGEIHTDPKERESIRKNVSNWFTPAKGVDSRVISRQYALEMCFILGLDEEQADKFLIAASGEGLHYRSAEEFVIAYALRNKMSFPEAKELINRASPDIQGEKAGDGLTRIARSESYKIKNEEQLIQYLEEHSSEFGLLRNTAYEYFSEMLDVLQKEEEDFENDNKKIKASVEELVMNNLYRRFIGRKKGGGEIEKCLRAGWPEESLLSKMRSRDVPVTRKVLILLFLASGGEISDDPADVGDYINETDSDSDFETLFTDLNAMLSDCGFGVIDPRAPFDWMVIYCIATGDIFDIDQRFGEVLSAIFGNDEQQNA